MNKKMFINHLSILMIIGYKQNKNINKYNNKENNKDKDKFNMIKIK